MDLSVNTRTEDGVSVVEVAGEVDVYTAPTLRQHLLWHQRIHRFLPPLCLQVERASLSPRLRRIIR